MNSSFSWKALVYPIAIELFLGCYFSLISYIPIEVETKGCQLLRLHLLNSHNVLHTARDLETDQR